MESAELVGYLFKNGAKQECIAEISAFMEDCSLLLDKEYNSILTEDFNIDDYIFCIEQTSTNGLIKQKEMMAKLEEIFRIDLAILNPDYYYGEGCYDLYRDFSQTGILIKPVTRK